METPEPIYAFSVPSIADDLPLKCRLYHPQNLASQLHSHDSSKAAPCGALIAHPYAPLGGCYDDPVVLAITETLLGEGYVVGTFNFRGAADSEGRTSWTGKAEQEDYTSFAGFMVYYLHALQGAGLEPNRLETIPSMSNFEKNNERSFEPEAPTRRTPIRLILGGYSYGSLILARLSQITSIVQRFEYAETGTAAAEIILRSRTLAKQTNISLQESFSPSNPRGRQLKPDDAATTSPRRSLGASPITVGGEETDPSSRRRSRDSRRSADLVRKSIEAPSRIKAHIKGTSSPAKHSVSARELSHSRMGAARTAGVPRVEAQYLVISPVLLPFSHQLCPPGPPSVLPGLRKQTDTDAQVGASFLDNPTLALFGTSDVFTASRRLRAWAGKMSDRSEKKFQWQEIAGAGHFWHEDGVMHALRERIVEWTRVF